MQDRVNPVSDCDDSAVFELFLDRLLDLVLCIDINVGRGLID
jgi:hypothetical protein